MRRKSNKLEESNAGTFLVFQYATTNKLNKMKLKKIIIGIIGAGLLGSATARAADVEVTADVTGNTTWFATNTYFLRTVVYVQSNAVLTIEPGTVIKGGTSNLLTRTHIPLLVSALWVTRGGKLYATGTVERPIIFTYDGDPLDGSWRRNALGTPLSGQWGGIVLLGNAVINSALNLGGHGSTPIYEQYEGVAGPGANGEHLFGGGDDEDNSGALRYVSIRYTGKEFETGRELNGLTMGGVGRGTTIEFVEVFGCSDDAFEWWGGTVNTRNLVAAFCEDDDFDTDQGYRGTNQFWFGIKPPWTGTGDSRGFETDGDVYQTAINTNFPISQWVVHNATLIGRGTNEAATTLGRGWNARDEAAPNVINSIVTDFHTGLLLDSDGMLYFTNSPPEANALNNIWGVAVATATANGSFLFSDASRSNTVENPLLGGVSYTNNLGLNPRPQPGSPALGNVLAGAPTPVNYRGAFGPNDNWADSWTAISTLGILAAPACAQPTLTIARNGSNVDISFPSQIGCDYQLQSTDTLTAGAGSWGDEGTPVSGTGSTITATRAVSGLRFFRVVTQ